MQIYNLGDLMLFDHRNGSSLLNYVALLNASFKLSIYINCQLT